MDLILAVILFVVLILIDAYKRQEAKRLIEVTKQSFFEGIKLAVPGNHLFDISEAIQKYVESNGYSVVRDLVGHEMCIRDRRLPLLQ